MDLGKARERGQVGEVRAREFEEVAEKDR